MSDAALREAERRLRGHGRYDWLLDGQPMWTVAEIVEQHNSAVGVQVSHDVVTRWFNACPHTINYGGPIGLRATRDDLARFFAGRMRGDNTIETIETVVPPQRPTSRQEQEQEPMQFYVYENWTAHTDRPVKIHTIACAHRTKGGTDPSRGKEHGPFATYAEARATELERLSTISPLPCRFCHPERYAAAPTQRA